MSRAAVKKSRLMLRSISEHLEQAHRNFGAQQKTVGLVDVLYHPHNRAAHLNYVTPRRNTAWIPAPQIEQGLEYLRKLERRARVYYVEGLFLPVFARSLHKLGLQAEQEITLLTYQPKQPLPAGSPPEGCTVAEIDNQEGAALWWYVWRNAYYDVITHGTEPLYIGQTLREVALGHQIDLLVYRYSFPIGVARVTFHEDTAHISAAAVMREQRTPTLTHWLYRTAVIKAVEQGANMIFTSGSSETERKACRDIGFVDSGSIVCYAEAADERMQQAGDHHVAAPLFIHQQ